MKEEMDDEGRNRQWKEEMDKGRNKQKEMMDCEECIWTIRMTGERQKKCSEERCLWKKERGSWKETLKNEKAYRFRFKSRFRFIFEKMKRKANETKSFSLKL